MPRFSPKRKADGIIPRMDFSATPDDPHGYKKLRSAVDSFARQLQELGLPTLAARLRDSQKYEGMPSEWMGETAFALSDVLATTWLPNRLRRDMDETVEAIRVGFRRVGSTPSF
jgi:hypothetical protein